MWYISKLHFVYFFFKHKSTGKWNHVFLKSGGAWAKQTVSECHFHIFLIYEKFGSHQTFTSISYMTNNARCFTKFLTLFKKCNIDTKKYNSCGWQLIYIQVSRSVINSERLSVKNSKLKHHSGLTLIQKCPVATVPLRPQRDTPKSSLFSKLT